MSVVKYGVLLVGVVLVVATCRHRDPGIPTTDAPSKRGETEAVICVVSASGPRLIEAFVTEGMGDTLVVQAGYRVPISSAFPQRYAANREWHLNRDSIRVLGRRYDLFGRPVTITPEVLLDRGTRLRQIDEYDGVMVLAEPGDSAPPMYVYLPLRAGCEFAGYIESAQRVIIRDGPGAGG